MATPQFTYYVARSAASTLRRLFRSASRSARRSGFRQSYTAELPLGPFNPAPWSRGFFRESLPSARPTRLVVPRTRLPVLGLRGSIIDTVPVVGPHWSALRFPRPGPLPAVLPKIVFSSPRSPQYYEAFGIVPYPEYEAVFSLPELNQDRQTLREANRKRQDSKEPNRFYNRSLSWFTRNFGRYTEYLDFVQALYYSGGNPYLAATNLAINEAIDIAAGTQARFLRDNVYRKAAWPFPVGWPVLSRVLPG